MGAKLPFYFWVGVLGGVAVLLEVVYRLILGAKLNQVRKDYVLSTSKTTEETFEAQRCYELLLRPNVFRCAKSSIISLVLVSLASLALPVVGGICYDIQVKALASGFCCDCTLVPCTATSCTNITVPAESLVPRCFLSASRGPSTALLIATVTLFCLVVVRIIDYCRLVKYATKWDLYCGEFADVGDGYKLLPDPSMLDDRVRRVDDFFKQHKNRLPAEFPILAKYLKKLGESGAEASGETLLFHGVIRRVLFDSLPVDNIWRHFDPKNLHADEVNTLCQISAVGRCTSVIYLPTVSFLSKALGNADDKMNAACDLLATCLALRPHYREVHRGESLVTLRLDHLDGGDSGTVDVQVWYMLKQSSAEQAKYTVELMAEATNDKYRAIELSYDRKERTLYGKIPVTGRMLPILVEVSLDDQINTILGNLETKLAAQAEDISQRVDRSMAVSIPTGASTGSTGPTGFTGPTGAAQESTGPTGAIGAAQESTGPTGAIGAA